MKIRELHDRLYDMLIIIDKICRENDIPYWVHGGTAIGAVRERDFIPWDDDLDIKILSEDYEAFREAMIKNLPSHLHLIEPPDFYPYFYDMVIRILDDRWFLRKEKPEDKAYKDYTNRVGIDVFLSCGCPKSAIAQKLFILQNTILYGMCMRFRKTIDYSKYTMIQKVQVAVLRCLGRIYSGNTPERVYRTWLKFIQSYDANKTGWRIMINSPIGMYYMVPLPNEWFNGTVYSKIRQLNVPLIAGYDQELRFIYGNYMVPERNTDKYYVHLEDEDFDEV